MNKSLILFFISVFFIFGCASHNAKDFSGRGFGGAYYNGQIDLAGKSSQTVINTPKDHKKRGFGGVYYIVAQEKRNQEVVKKEY